MSQKKPTRRRIDTGSGGKARLGKITKAGDAYLCTLLVQGARSVMIGVEHKQDPFSRWVCSLTNRRGYWRAVVAIAAKKRPTMLGIIELWR